MAQVIKGTSLPVSGVEKHSRVVTFIRQIVFYAALIALWEGIVRLGIWPDYSLPSPFEVVTSLVNGFSDGSFINAILVSLGRIAIGYSISLVIGVILGLLLGRNRIVEETLGSLVLGLQALPSVCWLPLSLLWFGLTEQAVIFVVVMGALFSITLGVDAGVKNTPPLYLKAAVNMGAHGLGLATRVILPAALPAVITGLKQGWTFAWRSLMAAELLYYSLSLGNLLQTGRDLNDMAQVMAVMVVIIAIGIAVEALIFNPLERRVRARWGLGGA